MDEHNNNVNNWKNSWKDNWKGRYQSTDDGYQFDGYEDDSPQPKRNLKQLSEDMRSRDAKTQKAAIAVFATGLVTAIIVIGFIIYTTDLPELIARFANG